MLELINQTGDINKIPENRLDELAAEIRRYMVDVISENGGHLASSLGTVELTLALHRVYDLPKDKIIWDVGHQTYTHKILTGRRESFRTIRKEGGLSGFPRRNESEADSFDTGHSSTSVSAGLGYVKAAEILKKDYHVVSVIGDGALTGGLAFEALNNAARLKTNYVVVLNDNEMSISKNVGGISDYLDRIRTSENYTSLKMSVSAGLESIPGIGTKMVNAIRKTKGSIKQIVIPGMFFEDMGFTYLGPVDGHNIRQLIKVFTEARSFPGPVFVHVLTEKGKGYAPASKNPVKFHGISAAKLTEDPSPEDHGETFSSAFSSALISAAREDRTIAAVTAAMKEGTGLRRFASLYPERFFDVGIAEGHAVTFAAGLALGGLKPVVAVYSSFLQRGFDQLLMDVCLQNLPVVFAIDRAGFVGEDGKTHQGTFDLSYLSMMPNMTVMAPKNGQELDRMLRFAVKNNGPTAIRYSKGKVPPSVQKMETSPIEFGRAEILHKGSKIMIWAVGDMVGTGYETCMKLKEKGYDPTLVNVRFIKPFDTELLESLAKDHEYLMVLEENVENGGFGSLMLGAISKKELKVRTDICGAGDGFVSHGSVEQQRKRCGLDPVLLAGRAERRLKGME